MGAHQSTQSPDSHSEPLLPIEDHVRDHERRLDFVDKLSRLKATSLLFTGSLMGLLGFIFAALLGFYKSIAEVININIRGDQMEHSYFPATVSEMVHDPASPAGMVFFAFVVIGAICMMLSWYPWSLKNVYIGDDLVLPPASWNLLGQDRTGKPRGVSVLMLRQFLPPIGIMLVACIRAGPQANRQFTDKVSCTIHTIGAVMSIGGYAFIELYTLWGAPKHWGAPEGQKITIRFDVPIRGRRYPVRERTARGVLILGCLLSIVGFQICGALVAKGDSLGICCNDKWAEPKPRDWTELTRQGDLGHAVEDEIAAETHQKMLLQTASGAFLGIKLACYWFEVFSGLFMLASHMTIWFYCPERHVDLDEDLPDPDGHGGHYNNN